MNMPKSCEVADLAAWVHKMWAFDDRIMPEDTEMARAVRTLLDAKCREVIDEYEEPVVGGEWTAETVAHYAKLSERAKDEAISRVLGAP